MHELVVCSGKGGTGKTSLVASFAALASDPVIVDCDVDAANLHLVLAPLTERRQEFRSGRVAAIAGESCSACGICVDLCRFGAVVRDDRPGGDVSFGIDHIACEGCGVCARFCPEGAIRLRDRVCGEWFVSRTRHGPLVHAHLGIAAENSGKLVTLVRNLGNSIAQQRNADLILVDAPPGIGCPVIASMTGADGALVVTEPTRSGLHDLKRIVDLARHFGIPLSVCVNKYDINREVSDEIRAWCGANDLAVAGTIPFDPRVNEAQLAGASVVEHDASPAAEAIRSVWENMRETFAGSAGIWKEQV